MISPCTYLAPPHTHPVTDPHFDPPHFTIHFSPSMSHFTQIKTNQSKSLMLEEIIEYLFGLEMCQNLLYFAVKKLQKLFSILIFPTSCKPQSSQAI